jgi:hypothetical protein
MVFILLSTLALSACAIDPETDEHGGMAITPSAAAGRGGHNHPMAPLGDMPEMVRAADARTQEAYRFAAANPEAAAEVPCYCGCVGLGHETSYDCYVAGAAADGTLEYDMHAVNCTVCVDITQDQMRMVDNGDSPDAIRAYLAENYAKYGPPTEGITN